MLPGCLQTGVWWVAWAWVLMVRAPGQPWAGQDHPGPEGGGVHQGDSPAEGRRGAAAPSVKWDWRVNSGLARRTGTSWRTYKLGRGAEPFGVSTNQWAAGESTARRGFWPVQGEIPGPDETRGRDSGEYLDILCRPENSFDQVIDGYFVHFTEDDPKLEALPKYTVFVLDVSLIYLSLVNFWSQS